MANNIQIQLFDLKSENKYLKKDLDKIFNDICSTASFVKGPYLESFEKKFADYIGTNYCIGVASGTDALQLSLHALGIGPGDEVILPANTFIATAYAVMYVGAKPVFVDINEKTFNVDFTLIEKAITKKTKAIIAVHLYGNPAEMDKITTIAKKHKLFVIEDAAQAHGAIYGKKRVGNLGDIAAFSFYPSKNLGAYGDGGAIITNSKRLATRLKKIREYGSSAKYIFDEIGFNSRLDALQAAILELKLSYLDAMNARKIKVADYYTKKFNKELPFIKTPFISQNTKHAYHLYTIRIPKRDLLSKFLAEKGIATGVYYPVPLHLQKALKELGYKKGDFPLTEKMSKDMLCLPIFPELTRQQQDYIIDLVISFYKK